MNVFVIRKGASITAVVKQLMSSDDIEVIVRKINNKPSSEYKAVYWINLRKVANHIGEDVKSVHKLSRKATECFDCDPLRDLDVIEFRSYFNAVMWYWQSSLDLDLGVL